MAKLIGEMTWTHKTPCPACGLPHRARIFEAAGRQAALCRDTGVEVSVSEESKRCHRKTLKIGTA